MADIASAQGLVMSVLETAGYLTQERILTDFKDFFDKFGTFLYLLACIGGLLSMVLFGSYRTARYLLLGPMFYLMLVAPTGEGEGLLWKTGPNEYRHIRVSRVFGWFTTTINSLTGELTKVLDSHTNDEQLPFMGRARAFEVLMNMQIEDKDLLEMFGSILFTRCQEMMDVSMALSSPEVTQMRIEEIKTRANGLQTPAEKEALLKEATRIEGRRSELYQRQAQAAKRSLHASPALKRFIETKLGTAGPQGQKIQSYFQQAGITYDPNTETTLQCGMAWSLVEMAIWDHSDKLISRLLGDFTGSTDEKQNLQQGLNTGDEAQRRHKLCVELSHKIGGFQSDQQTGNGQFSDQCDLPAVAGIFLVRNAIIGFDREKRLQFHHDNTQALAAVPNGQITAQETVSHPGDKPRQLRLVGGAYNYQLKWIPGENGDSGFLAAAFIDEGSEDKKVEWLPFSKVTEITGHFGSAFKEHQGYQTRGLRASLFAIASQVPYWQGVMIYLLTISYPFICLAVLIPGKGQAVFYAPLAWLWLQSWKAGFVIVDMLDQIIWNMFPHTDVPFQIEGQPLQYAELPNVLTEAMKIDPTFNVHVYEFVLSISFTFVTVGLGAAILKSKRGILAAFAGAMAAQGKDAMERGEGAYGVATMNKRLRQEKELMGAAVLSKAGNQAIMEAENRSKNSQELAAARTGANTVYRTADALSQPKGRLGALAETAAAVPQTYNRTWWKLMKANLGHDAQYASAFDRRLGRWGAWAMMADATTAAMDAEGGYEINEQYGGSGAWTARIELMTSELKVKADTLEDGVGTASKTYGILKSIIPFGGILPYIAGVPTMWDLISGNGSTNSFTSVVAQWIPGVNTKFEEPSPLKMFDYNYGPRGIKPREWGPR